MNVVMVHGFLDTGRLYRRMSAVLGARGHACHAPTLEPRDGRLGIPDLSGKLASFIEDRVPSGAPTALVGFSLGALIARYYLQSLGGARRVSAFFSLCGPHRGTLPCYLFPGEATRQMRYRSAFLRELEARRGALDGLSVHTYRTPLDLMVVPSTSGRIAGSREVVVWSPFHSLMPVNPKVLQDIGDVLAQVEADAGAAPVLSGTSRP